MHRTDKALILYFVFLLTAAVSEAEIINHFAPGNLESTQHVECESKLSNKMTPADLYPALPLCIKKSEYDKALFIYMLAAAYGKFDSLRVADQSAHQAALALGMITFENVDQPDRELFKKKIDGIYRSEYMRNKICKDIQATGAPQYFPRYMIQHGIRVFLTDKQENQGLIKDFNPRTAWKLVLKDYLKCPGM
ncbi:MAG: hypothetical protein ACRCU9_16725 [Iodobacter sp.]